MTAHSFIAYRGPSRLTGDPIVCVISLDSLNAKTGAMWQAWVLRADRPPLKAVADGADQAICGSCIHRTGVNGGGRSCYVALFTGPERVWQAYARGAYLELRTAAAVRQALRGEHVRVTAYGDPAAMPFDFWAEALADVAGWVGYTHQWRTADVAFASLLMASVETPSEAASATALGYRTFRARPAGSPLRPGEFVCPASDEGGHRTTCLRCQLCRGASSPAKSVAIELHGVRFKQAKGQVSIERRQELDAIRAQLEDGQEVEAQISGREFMRLLFSLRMFYRRRGVPIRLRTRTLATDARYAISLEARR